MTDPATQPIPGIPAPARTKAPRRPTRRIWTLVGIAALTTLAIVVLVNLTRANANPNIAVGQPVPHISGTALDGSTVDLASLRGHPVVINFWASWCVPCQQEMPLLAQKAVEHQASGLEILGVLSDDTVARGQAFEQQYGATWPSVFDGDGAIKRDYRVVGRPQSYFVDADGILQSIQIGYLTDADFELKFAKIAPSPGAS